MNCSSRRQRGFTLIEILIAIGLMAVMVAVSYPIFNSMLVFGQQQKTHARLLQVQQALTRAYEDNAMTVDTDTGAAFCGAGAHCVTSTASSNTQPSAVSASSALGAGTAAALAAIAQAQGINTRTLEVDGFGKYYHYYVSDKLTSQSCTNCPQLYYHVIAVVSTGGKNALSPNTHFNASTGQLTLGTGDQGIVVSGLPIEQKYVDETMKQLRRVADAYGQFFTFQYLNSSSRNPSIDYFSQPDQNDMTNSQNFDASNPICNSGNQNCGYSYNGVPYPGEYGTPLTNSGVLFWDCQPATVLGGFMESLGLTPTDVMTPWGYPIGVCNGPNAPGAGLQSIRNPSSNSTALQSPPYTADIVAWAPGGTPLAVSVVGKY
ncbi:hypothetical protein BW247_05160 [Acidihalobacter ferrooxydans]|uniref:Prepilin-type N-terminal cleavage/methylation domain-containing protein n=1 Tax=Acidihalobacter ferrooxydans TaxID=1765967 RepID=A0A1P8UFG0_9GAMM|nr:hypothetical protein BW247_05160 [Acidihalobacter ferrooxydans]